MSEEDRAVKAMLLAQQAMDKIEGHEKTCAVRWGLVQRQLTLLRVLMVAGVSFMGLTFATVLAGTIKLWLA